VALDWYRVGEARLECYMIIQHMTYYERIAYNHTRPRNDHSLHMCLCINNCRVTGNVWCWVRSDYWIKGSFREICLRI